MRQFIFIGICCFFNMGLIAQTENNAISIGTHVTINSKILNQDRTLQIYLPDSYATSDKKYPVLYILDGQWYFSSGVSIQMSLRNPDAIPEMIIVGINSSRQLRYALFGDESNRFTTFVKNEVLPFIDSEYRTTDERIIFGWEAAAFYVSELILKENQLFSGAIISNGGGASEETIKTFKSDKEIYAYIANSKKDIFTITESDTFHKLLVKNKPENLIWKYELINDEFHETLPHLAMFKGIRYYYHNHGSLIFEDIDTYVNLGGIPYLQSYFKERSERFGGDGTINNATKDILIWLAWHRDNFEYFSIFMEEFKEVLSTKRYDSAYWQNRFGQFYLKHKDYQNAFKYFNVGLTKYPNSEFEQEMREGRTKAKTRQRID